MMLRISRCRVESIVTGSHRGQLRLSRRCSNLVVSAADLEDFGVQVLQRSGCSAEEAAVVSSSLVESNLKGHDSHGIGYLPVYVRGILSGKISLNATPSFSKVSSQMIHCDAKVALGQVIAKQCIEFTLPVVEQEGMALICLQNSHHLGRIGSYAEQWIEHGFCSIHLVNVAGHNPLVAAFGGKEARLGTNPIAIGWAMGDPPLVLDMATSELALGKVRESLGRGEEVEDGVVIDHLGKPTRDPSVMFKEPKGALLPFGKHKGYGLALMCELFGAVLSGGNTIHPKYERSTRGDLILNSMFSFVFDPRRISPLSENELKAETELVRAFMKESSAQSCDHPVEVAGEAELRAARIRAADGIRLSKGTFDGLMKAAKSVGMSSPETVLFRSQK